MVDKTEEVAEIVVDFLNAVEAAAVNSKMQIAKLYTSIQDNGTEETIGLTWNPEQVKWEVTEGSRGSYERSEDVNSTDFKMMVKDLAEHKGKLTRDKKFYWLFQNGYTVGRKDAKWSMK